ncbi:hypothetical protein [Hymenobacter sp. GOD-10R]|uniref:hypothetical protein n=1 Tax=Hymenobacter sp. GOD-10R TaxID=3093922 RepID=UPI002D766CFD|nr:hypothetical protein [Hymenobacter sp. GOD-10R]WRQ28445.1 hypothetical protein SD425_25570 [Hymenobacter sp. GOD-10R]
MRRSKLLLGGLLLLLLPVPLSAQQATQPSVPKYLLGTWQLQQLAFDARRPLNDAQIEQLFHDPAGEINQELKHGQLIQQLTFRPDGSYLLSIRQATQGAMSEQGTYWVRHDTLYARTASGQAAAFSGEVLARLKAKELILEFPFWKPQDQVFEQEKYQRVKQ